MGRPFNLGLYNDEFFQWHIQYVHAATIRMAKLFCEQCRVSSLLDVGCGIGSFLEGARQAGVPKIRGLEISVAAQKYTPETVRGLITYTDATHTLDLEVFDTVISTEVAEHIETEKSDTFVDNLVHAVGRWLIFTAAIPGDNNPAHINCQVPEFWTQRFIARGLFPRPALAQEIKALWSPVGLPAGLEPPAYYRDNLQVFAKGAA